MSDTKKELGETLEKLSNCRRAIPGLALVGNTYAAKTARIEMAGEIAKAKVQLAAAAMAPGGAAEAMRTVGAEIERIHEALRVGARSEQLTPGA